MSHRIAICLKGSRNAMLTRGFHHCLRTYPNSNSLLVGLSLAKSSFSVLPQGFCLSQGSYYCDKHHDQQQTGEERVYSILPTSITGRNNGRNTRQELNLRSQMNVAYWLVPPGFLSLLSFFIHLLMIDFMLICHIKTQDRSLYSSEPPTQG